MKRIQTACLLQTIRFQPKDGCHTEFDRQMVRQEYESYQEKLRRNGTEFKILEENIQPDGSILVRLKKQYNQHPVGDYFAD